MPYQRDGQQLGVGTARCRPGRGRDGDGPGADRVIDQHIHVDEQILGWQHGEGASAGQGTRHPLVSRRGHLASRPGSTHITRLRPCGAADSTPRPQISPPGPGSSRTRRQPPSSGASMRPARTVLREGAPLPEPGAAFRVADDHQPGDQGRRTPRPRALLSAVKATALCSRAAGWIGVRSAHRFGGHHRIEGHHRTARGASPRVWAYLVTRTGLLMAQATLPRWSGSGGTGWPGRPRRVGRSPASARSAP